MKQIERMKLAAAHISEHLEQFHGHAGKDRDPLDYLNDYWYKYEEPGEIYPRLCNDIDIEPKAI